MSEIDVVGITTGTAPHVIYNVKRNQSWNLEAVPVAGGSPVVLQVASDPKGREYVSGGAVAWSTSEENGISNTVHLWTKASGIKSIDARSRLALFVATEDGSRVAFSANATATATDIVVTTSNAPSAAAQALADVSVPLLDSVCAPHIDFAGMTLIAAYCAGENRAQQKLVTVAPDGAPVVRIDNVLPADAFQARSPFAAQPDDEAYRGGWVADATGTKIVVVGRKPEAQARLVLTDGEATTIANLDAQVATVDVARDGSAIVYRAGNALKKATFAEEPLVTTLVAGGVQRILAMSADSKSALFSTRSSSARVPDTANARATHLWSTSLTDANTIDVTAQRPSVVSIVATPTASNIKFNGAGTQVLYIDSWGSASAGQLKAKPTSGGTERVLDVASFGSFPAPSGNGVLSASTHTPFGGLVGQESFSIGYADSVAGGAAQPVADAVFFNAYYGKGGWSDRSLVFLDPRPGSAGLYAIAMPSTGGR